MTPADIRTAIAASPELQALVPDTSALAAALSAGRTKLAPTEIGVGTVLATLGSGAGAWIDGLTTVGEQNRDVYWALTLLHKGTLRIDMPATRVQMQALAEAVPALAGGIGALLGLCVAPDPVPEFDVRAAIFADDGALLV